MKITGNNLNIDSASSLGENVSFGNNVTIYAGCKIGNNVKIGSNVIIYNNTVIGDNTIIWDNVVIGRVPMGVSGILRKIEPIVEPVIIQQNSIIGCGTIIYAGTKIGSECLIGDNTVIRENCELIENVIIGPNCSLQNNVQIQHGTRILQQSVVSSFSRIGKNNFISFGFTSVSDKAFGKAGFNKDKVMGPKIGDNNQIGPNVTLLDNIEIGNDNVIGAMALVTKTIENNGVYIGIPCKLIRNRVEDGKVS